MTILCPTDFSHTAASACRLAVRIATDRDYQVHIIHAYQPFRSAFQGQLNNEADESRARSEAQNEMEKFVRSLELGESKVSITSSLSEGTLVRAINRYTEKESVPLIVMGTEGAKGVAGSLTGSNSYYLAKDTPVPVLLVPEGYTLGGLRHAVFFTDYQPDDRVTLEAMKHVLGSHAISQCTLVHITRHQDSDEVANEEKKLLDWKLRLEEAVGIDSLQTMVVMDKEHVATIENVLKQTQADLTLITVVGGRGFFERLMKKSLARAIILNPKTPVLLVNQDSPEST